MLVLRIALARSSQFEIIFVIIISVCFRNHVIAEVSGEAQQEASTHLRALSSRFFCLIQLYTVQNSLFDNT